MRPIVILAGFVAVILTNPVVADGVPKPEAYTASHLSDRAQIIDVIGSVGFYADQRRWDLVAAAFAEKAVIDYRSHGTAAAGQIEPQALTPKEIVTAWQTQLPGYLHTQHLVTNSMFIVEGARATAKSQVYATHYLPNEGDDYWTSWDSTSTSFSAPRRDGRSRSCAPTSSSNSAIQTCPNWPPLG